MIDAMGGSGERFLSWKVLNSGLYESLAKSNPAAVQGLKQHFTMADGAWGRSWVGAGGDTDTGRMIAGLCSVVPPPFSTIEQQTGMQLLPGLVKRADAAAKDQALGLEPSQ